MTEAERRAALAAVVRRGSRPGALAKACLLVARGEYPRLDPTVSLAEIARLAGRVREAAAPGAAPPWRVLADVLGRSEGYRGDVHDYDNPENSYLNRVLAHRHGLPILLCVVWIEAARGAGVDASGVGLPGHFIVQVGRGAYREAVYVDPFSGGRRLTWEAAMSIAVKATGDASLVPSEVLRITPPRQIVLRVLANLVGSYERRGDCKRLLRVLSDQLALAPDDARVLARRGEVLAESGEVRAGLADLNRALTRMRAGETFERTHAAARRIALSAESVN